MLKFKNSTTGNQNFYVLHAHQVHDKFLVESYSFLTLLVDCSTKHFLRSLINLLHISES